MDLLTKKKVISFKYYGIIILFFAALLFSLMLLFEHKLGSYTIGIRTLKIPIYPMPYFLDLKLLLCGIEVIGKGINPYDELYCWSQQNFNYPISWSIFSLFPFFKANNNIIIGIIIFFIFYISVIIYTGKLPFILFIFYFFILFSPSVLLGLDRANSDLIIFIFLISTLIITTNKYYITSIILLCSFLKLFPIGAVLSLIKIKNRSNRFLTITLSSILFLLFIYVFQENIKIVSLKTPRPYQDYSFGLQTIPNYAINIFKIDKSQVYFFFYLLLILLITTLAFFKYQTFFKYKLSNSKFGYGYLIGSGIFIVSYIIGNNFEYRFVFLILTIPQIFIWRKSNTFLNHILVLYLIIFWQTGINYFTVYLFSSKIYIFIGQFIVMYLFAFHFIVSLVTLLKHTVLEKSIP